jgi:hypothetical protein
MDMVFGGRMGLKSTGGVRGSESRNRGVPTEETSDETSLTHVPIESDEMEDLGDRVGLFEAVSELEFGEAIDMNGLSKGPEAVALGVEGLRMIVTCEWSSVHPSRPCGIIVLSNSRSLCSSASWVYSRRFS